MSEFFIGLDKFLQASFGLGLMGAWLWMIGTTAINAAIIALILEYTAKPVRGTSLLPKVFAFAAGLTAYWFLFMLGLRGAFLLIDYMEEHYPRFGTLFVLIPFCLFSGPLMDKFVLKVVSKLFRRLGGPHEYGRTICFLSLAGAFCLYFCVEGIY